jgi:hypothetical protein
MAAHLDHFPQLTDRMAVGKLGACQIGSPHSFAKFQPVDTGKGEWTVESGESAEL